MSEFYKHQNGDGDTPLYDLQQGRAAGFSVAAAVFSALSILFASLWQVALLFLVLAVLFIIVSARQSGRLNRGAVLALVLGAIGTLFLILSILCEVTLADPTTAVAFEEWLAMLREQYGLTA